jgi:ABC-2 type transport system permease protein
MFKSLIDNLALITEACKKEFKLIFSDSAVKMSYMISFILVGFFYSYVYSYEIFTDLPVAVVDNDQSTMSRTVNRMLDGSPELEVAYTTTSMDVARKLFDQEKVKGIIVIPADFSKDIQKGNAPTVSAFCDASYMLYYKQTLGSVMKAVGTYSAQIEVNKVMAKGTPMKQAVESRRAFDGKGIPLFNINSGYGTFLLPVVFIIAIQTLQLTGMGILGGTLRERGIFAQTFAYANRRFSSIFLTIGRGLAYLIISLVLFLIQVCVVMHIFTFPQRGNLFEIVMFMIPVILAITFLGMTLINFFRKREEAIMTITIFSVPTLMISGASWPFITFPVWLKVIAVFVPSTLGVQGFLSLSQFGASLIDIKDIYIQVWGLALFYFVTAVWTNRRLQQKGIKTLEKEKVIDIIE